MSGRKSWLVIAFVALSGVLPSSAAAEPAPAEGPLVIGHRGASGHLPEHTLAAYRLAVRLGADYVEPDLVATKDGHLIARHEPNITSTTDVRDRPEFADRKRTAVVDGIPEEGWFASDFTLAEIRTLRADPAGRRAPAALQRPLPDPDPLRGHQPSPSASRSRRAARSASSRRPSTRPTTSSSACRSSAGSSPRCAGTSGTADRRRCGSSPSSRPTSSCSTASRACASCSSSTPTTSIRTGRSTSRRPTTAHTIGRSPGDPELQARTFAHYTTDAGLAEIKQYADAIGPWKPYILSTAATDANGDGVVGDENGDGLDERDGPHGARADRPRAPRPRERAPGLPYTFRNEQRRLAADYQGNPVNEYLRFYELGVDGVFSDFPETAFAARELFRLASGDGEIGR
jgi:glycerophosphoryl diester phosphodiesterase